MEPLTTAVLVRSFKKEIFSALSFLKDEIMQTLDSGLSDYIESQTDKFLWTKTFLSQNDKVDFFQTYYPVQIKNKAKYLTLNDNIFDLFENSNYATIIGIAGSGKTMLMKNIFLQLIQNPKKIPIVIELRDFNLNKKPLKQFIYEKILNNKLAKNQGIIERLLEEGAFVILLDGYDEIYSDRKEEITSDIDEFIDIYKKNNFVITSRPGTSIQSMPRFDNYTVQPLNDNDIKKFIKKQLSQEDEEKLANKIIDTIYKQNNKDYMAYLSSPLLLSMFILTYNSYPEIPKSKSKFYWNVFDTLCTKHDSITKKGGFQHERKSNLLTEDFENILKLFSYISFFDGQFNFERKYMYEKLSNIKTQLKYTCTTDQIIDDLLVSISIIIQDGLSYSFPHRSMQEYFCALCIKERDEKTKEKIYSEKFINHFKSNMSNDTMSNFLSLCEEIDKAPFYIYFVIPYLDNCITKIKTLTDKDKLKEFINTSGISYYIENKEDTIGRGSIARYQNLFNFIIIDMRKKYYLDVVESKIFKHEEFQKVIPDLIRTGEIILTENYFGDENDTNWEQEYVIRNNKLLTNNSILDTMIKCNAIDVINETIKIIANEILVIKEEIKTEEKLFENILGI